MKTHIFENPSQKERRKFPRYFIETQLNLSIEDIRSSEPIGMGEVCDLSMGGLRMRYLQSHPQIDIGNSLGVLFMEEDITLFVRAEVIHSDEKDHYGLQFRDLTIAERQQLQRLIQYIAD